MNKLMKWILFFFSWTNDFLISVFGLKIVAFSLINSIPFSLNDFLAGMNVISLIIDDLLFGIVDGLFDVLVEMIIEFIFSLIVIVAFFDLMGCFAFIGLFLFDSFVLIQPFFYPRSCGSISPHLFLFTSSSINYSTHLFPKYPRWRVKLLEGKS